MLTCKQVAEALEREDYALLPPFKRFLLKFHVSMCFICRKYNRQRMLMHDMVRALFGHEAAGDILEDEQLDPVARERIKTAIKSSR